jgi:5'-3' exonuclease
LAGDNQSYIREEDVLKKLGVLPSQVVDYKAIVGDKSDNIPPPRTATGARRGRS